MLINVENGRPAEADLIGDLVRRADRLGIDVPILRAARCNLQLYEAQRLRVDLPHKRPTCGVRWEY
jgi:ketopantoate reductase